ncbi:DUF4270 family protein [Hymenobacter guriensis]|uniref:DUF4270 family protein n=1 Tax=Hymenobacter guriensis TaxID=2793065 RepID=A0ABS0L4N1_9BACT|nr:DUF4270 family protein [Hymenobacter guriensis]MBG8554503.1 DUF4270 family protein [Hymenobacter guriensis]
MNWPTRSFQRAAAIFFSASLLLTACEDPNTVGLELPGSTPLTTEFKDLAVTASTIQQDSLPTTGRNHYLVGRLQDATLGTITARTFFEAQVSNDSIPALFTGAQLDSVVLYFGFDQIYGPTTVAPRFDVYKLAAPLDSRTTYNSSSSLPTDVALATNVAVKTNRRQMARQRVNPSSTTDTTTKIVDAGPLNVIRLPLVKSGQSTAFTTALFTALNTPGFNQAALNNLLPGFSLQPNASYASSILRFGRTTATRAIVYYRAGKTKQPDVPIKRTYIIRYANASSSSATGQPDPNAPRYFTQLTTQLNGALATLVSDKDSVPSANTNGLTYLQEGTGIATKLYVSGLAELAQQKNIVVNRAELIIPARPYANARFAYPLQAFLYEVNKNNQILTRVIDNQEIDRVVQASGFSPTSSGNAAPVDFYDSGSATKGYSVLLTSYIQAYLNNTLGEKPAGFVLTASPRLLSNLVTPRTNGDASSTTLAIANNLTLNRAVLDANNIKLRVYYSRL